MNVALSGVEHYQLNSLLRLFLWLQHDQCCRIGTRGIVFASLTNVHLFHTTYSTSETLHAVSSWAGNRQRTEAGDEDEFT